MEDQVIRQKSGWVHDLEYRARGGAQWQILSDVPDKARVPWTHARSLARSLSTLLGGENSGCEDAVLKVVSLCSQREADNVRLTS